LAKLTSVQGFKKKAANPGSSNSICLLFGVRAAQM